MGTLKDSGKTKDCLNKKYRQPFAKNLRYSPIDGKPLATASYFDGESRRIVAKRIGSESVPLKILPLASGAPSIRKIVFNSNETIVIFDGGDRVAVACAKADAFDRNTAVAWAVLKYILGNNVGRRIDSAIRKLGVDANAERLCRGSRKDAERAAKAEKIRKHQISVNG